jgi:PAS domain S-box-containing protein
MSDETTQLLDESKKFQAIFENAPLGIYTINTAGIIDSFNPEMVTLAGAVDANAVLGLNALTLPSYQEVGLTEHFRKGLQGEAFFVPSVKYTSYTGSKVSYRSYRGIPLRNEKGEVEHLLCLVLDITEKVEMEETRQHILEKDDMFKKMNEYMIGREARMIELKEKIHALEEKLEAKK